MEITQTRVFVLKNEISFQHSGKLLRCKPQTISLYGDFIRIVSIDSTGTEKLFPIYTYNIPEEFWSIEVVDVEIPTMASNQSSSRGFGMWEVLLDNFSIGIGSHSRNPNASSLLIPKGTHVHWESDSNNGNVWFKTRLNGVSYRGCVESGSIEGVLKRGFLKLISMEHISEQQW